MAKQSRVSLKRKKELDKPDSVISTLSLVMKYIVEKKVFLSGVFCIFIVLTIVFSGYNYYSTKSENTAFELLEKAMFKYNSVVKDKVADNFESYPEKELINIIENHSRTNGAKYARMALADIYHQLGSYDKAINLYNESLKDFKGKPVYRNIVLNCLGYSYEGKKDYKTAVTYFEKITSGSDEVMKGEAFFNLGRIYSLIGDDKKSREFYEKVLSDYKESLYIEMVKEKSAG